MGGDLWPQYSSPASPAPPRDTAPDSSTAMESEGAPTVGVSPDAEVYVKREELELRNSKRVRGPSSSALEESVEGRAKKSPRLGRLSGGHSVCVAASLVARTRFLARYSHRLTRPCVLCGSVADRFEALAQEVRDKLRAMFDKGVVSLSFSNSCKHTPNTSHTCAQHNWKTSPALNHQHSRFSSSFLPAFFFSGLVQVDAVQQTRESPSRPLPF